MSLWFAVVWCSLLLLGVAAVVCHAVFSLVIAVVDVAGFNGCCVLLVVAVVVTVCFCW